MDNEIKRDEVTTRLANYSVSVLGTEIQGRARDAVGRRLIDSIACAYGALDSEPVVALRALAQERSMPDGCTVWGSAVSSTPEIAALANGTAIRFLDYSDYTSGGHPSDNIAAVIAACEWTNATVDDLVAGILVNYEVWGELGRLYLRYRGWDQGTTATIAAVCAVGNVLGLTADQLASAIGIVATNNISLVKLRRGEISAWKALAVPYAAQSSVLVACLVAKGITGPQDAFAGEFGFWQQVSGEFHIHRLRPGVEPATIFNTGYKHWPVEYEAQFAVWLAQQVRSRLSIAEIDHLTLYTSEWTWKAIANDTAKWAPTTRETADHSLPYIFAVALTRGRIDPEDFDPAVLGTPGYVDLMARISVNPDEGISSIAHERCAFRATAHTKSGDKLQFEINEPRAKPMTDDELDDKWNMLTARSALADRSVRLHADLRKLDGSQRVRDLMAPLRA